MLDSLTPSQIDEWLAYSSLEPFDNDSLKWTIANAAAAICHAFGAKVMPWDILGKKEPAKQVAPSMASALFGGNRGNNR